MPVEQLPTYCALCISRCGCLAEVDDGRLLRILPDPAHPTGKAICVKAKAAPELVYHPDRLTTPLLRTRPKGDPDPGWRAISWDEALAITAARLGQHAPEATAFAVTTPSGTAMADSFGWVHRLAHAFASPNLVFATENCNWHKDFSPALTWGNGIGMPDYERTGCMLMWGVSPTTTWLAHAEMVRMAKRRGAKLIVVDPRGGRLAGTADLWLAPRPGTDAALALGLIHLLLTEGGVDEDFLRDHTDADQPAPDGRGTVRERLAERAALYPPDVVERLTGVAPGPLRAAAALLRDSRPASLFTWTGTCQQANATNATRAVNVLYALLGDLDAPGGNTWFSKPPVADIAGFEWVTPELRARTLGMSERPLGPPSKGWITTRDLFRAVTEAQPYPVRNLVAFGGNFLLSKPATRHAEEALAKLDFFVQTELFVTPTARWADLLLPAASCWEREGLQAGFMVSQQAESWVQLRPAVARPPGEAKSDTWIVFALAQQLGLADRFFGGDIEAGLAHVLAPAGLTPALLRETRRCLPVTLSSQIGQQRQKGFATPAGKVALWSERLRQAGYDPLPDYAAAATTSAFPFVLTCGKITAYCHSQQRNQPMLRKLSPVPVAELAPDVATTRQICEGDAVTVRTAVAGFHATAHINPLLPPATVWAQYGWWDDADDISYNAAMDGESFDPVSGSNALRGVACDLLPRRGA